MILRRNLSVMRYQLEQLVKVLNAVLQQYPVARDKTVIGGKLDTRFIVIHTGA